MTKFQSILARVKSHSGKPYSLRLTDAAVFALEYVLAQEQQRIAESAGKRYLTENGTQVRTHGIQRTDIVSRALVDTAKRYHEWEHNGDEDESHPAAELVGIVGAGGCPVCARLNESK